VAGVVVGRDGDAAVAAGTVGCVVVVVFGGLESVAEQPQTLPMVATSGKESRGKKRDFQAAG
jgi:hypothetical protein